MKTAPPAKARHITRPAHTFSIVARDAATGRLGVAVQSHWFSVGPVVPWAEAGVGAVATQSFVDPVYGMAGLEIMRAGRTPHQALAGLLSQDPGADYRQVAMVDTAGNIAAHTGPKCIPAAGHLTGKGFSTQANLMLNAKVWPAMAAAYSRAKGDFAARMLAALDAGQAVGGDIRGRQSAAILIVNGTRTGKPWVDRVMDLRVEDHPEPLVELRRLVQLHRAYQHMNAGDLAVEVGDIAKARREYGAAEKMFPEHAEMVFWHAIALANAGKIGASLPLFKRAFAASSNWVELTTRLKRIGVLKAGAAEVKRILNVRRGAGGDV